MKREEILAMQPGRELDDLVAEHVMGWVAWEEKRGEYFYILFQKPGEKEPYDRFRNPETEKYRYRKIEFSEINHMKHIVAGMNDFSTDLSAAWEVVEMMMSQEWSFSMTNWGSDDPFKVVFGFEEGPYKCSSKKAPEAICKAALLAVLEC